MKRFYLLYENNYAIELISILNIVFTLSKKLIANSVIPTFINIKTAAPNIIALSEGTITLFVRNGLNFIINIIANNT